MTEFVINVSNIISAHCHSLLRLEPYSACPFKCPYCYSKWYIRGPVAAVYPRARALRGFAELARRIYRRGLRPIPFRVATLVDPLPPHEELYKATERILRIALEHSYPLIVNTKSTLISREPWSKLLASLAEQGLVVVQVSLSTLNTAALKLLEPNAPGPLERLRALRELAASGVPASLRVAPFVPYLMPVDVEGAEGFAEIAKEAGVRHVVVEGLRAEREVISGLLRDLVGRELPVEGYSLRELKGMSPLSRVSRRLLGAVLELYRRALERRGIAFATCKEGLFNLHSAPDCCAFYLLREAARRPTLWDVYLYVKVRGPSTREEVLEGLRKSCELLFWDALTLYPRAIAKPLRHHERRLAKILGDRGLLRHATPSLDIVEGGRIVVV